MPKIDSPRAPRRNARPKPPPPRSRRGLHLLLIFVTCVLLADAVVGERGLLATVRARRQHQQLADSMDALKRDNARLREHARRLQEDPRAIEAIARQELGLIRPGEIIFIIKDIEPPSGRPR